MDQLGAVGLGIDDLYLHGVLGHYALDGVSDALKGSGKGIGVYLLLKGRGKGLLVNALHGAVGKDKLVDKQNFDEINNASEIDKEFKME